MYSQSRGPACARLFATQGTGQPDTLALCSVRILRGGFIGWRDAYPNLVEDDDGVAGPKFFHVFDEKTK